MASIFEHQIAYVEDLNAFAPLADTARRAGVKGLAVKLYDAEPNPFCVYNATYLKSLVGELLRAQGFSIGVWAVPRLAPQRSAYEVSKLYKDHKLSFAIFETEWHYKTDGGGVDVAVLLDAWRSRRPKAYTGFAVEGGPPTTFNHAAVQADPYSFLCPESYWLQDAQYDVRACYRRCSVELGWDLARVKATLTGVEGHTMDEALIRLYRAHFDRFGELAPGFLLWRGCMLSAEDYRLVGLADNLARR